MVYVEYAVLAGAALALLRSSRSGWVRTAALTAVGTAALVFMLGASAGRGTPFGDFDKAYYPAGRTVLAAPARLYDCAHPDGLCFVNVPIVAVAFLPLSALPLEAAHVVFVVITCAALITTWAVLRRLAGRTIGGDGIAFLLLLNGPLLYGVRLGNLSHVVLALLALAVAAWGSGRTGRSGVLFGLSALVKPPLLIFLPYFVARRSWRLASSMAVTLAVVIVASLGWFGLDLHRAWLHQFVAPDVSNPMGAYNVQSLAGMLVRLTRAGQLVNWHPVPVGSAFRIMQTTLALVVIAGLGIVLLFSRRPASPRAMAGDVGIVLAAALALSPISWTHYYCWLLIPLAVTAGEIGAIRPLMRLAWLAGLALVSLPVALWVPSQPLAGAIVERVLLSHYLYGSLLLMAVWGRRALALQEASRPVRASARSAEVGISSR